jgi:membrane protein YqaA with SNARE-associated domain
MKFFSSLYARMMRWSAHPHAPYYLAGVSFAESAFFPIPPDIMLLSMGLAAPKRAWRYAWIATLFSVLGGVFGYLIGYYSMVLIEPYLLDSSYAATYLYVREWVDRCDLWMVMLAGFSPFPYKLFTITAGAMHLGFFYPFVLGSFFGRGLRFYIVASVLFFSGPGLEKHIRRFIDLIAWTLLLLIMIVYVVFKWVL